MTKEQFESVCETVYKQGRADQAAGIDRKVVDLSGFQWLTAYFPKSEPKIYKYYEEPGTN